MASLQSLRHHSKARAVNHAQRLQLSQTTETGQWEYLITLCMSGDDIKSAQTDRAGRPQHGNMLRGTQSAPQPASHSSAANTGIAAVRLSIRSSTPPWPGSRLLLSLTPDWRLNKIGR